MSKIQFKTGPRSKFRDQEFWAEGGMICIENQNNGDFKVITRAEAAARAIALNEELRYMQYPDERDELSRCVVNLCEAVKEGKRQGDPTNIEVRKQRIKDRRKICMLMTPSKISSAETLTQNRPFIFNGSALGTEIGPSDRFRKLKI